MIGLKWWPFLFFSKMFRTCFASDASPCCKRCVPTYSPTCAPTSGRGNGTWTYGRMATGGRNNLCWTNHEAARNHHRHHERGNKRPYQPKHSLSIPSKQHEYWCNIRVEYRVSVSSQLSSYIYAVSGFCDQMSDAPCVTSQQTFYKTYYKLPVSMFTYSVKRQPALIYNINATQ